jgi:hypothetical protein
MRVTRPPSGAATLWNTSTHVLQTPCASAAKTIRGNHELGKSGKLMHGSCPQKDANHIRVDKNPMQLTSGSDADQDAKTDRTSSILPSVFMIELSDAITFSQFHETLRHQCCVVQLHPWSP